MKQTIAVIVVIAVIFVGIYVTFKRELDQFNPLYKEEEVYVTVNRPAEPEKSGSYTRYRFNLYGFTEHGKKKKITFSSSTELEQNTYVKVVAKGAYSSKWTLIKKEDIPQDTQKKLMIE